MIGENALSFAGQLTPAGGVAAPVIIQIDGDRCRFMAGRRRLGSYELDKVNCERVSPFRFRLTVESEELYFSPVDPTGFSNAIGAVVDLRAATRFGLAERLRQTTTG